MFAAPSFRMGRMFGIPIEVNITWIVVFVLVSATLSFSYFPTTFPDRTLAVDLVSGVVTALLFFASIVIHEMSHSLVARAGGIKVEKVTLFLFGGVAQMEEDPATPGREFLMAIAGPLASLVLAAIFAALAFVMSAVGVSNVWWAPFEYLGIINVAVALFNMLPGFPLDGGRVLRSMLWGLSKDQLWATRWACRAGQFIGYSLMALAVFAVLRGSLNLIWLGLVGWFITVLADSAYKQQVIKESLHRNTVLSVASSDVVVAPAGITVEELIFDFFVEGPHTRYPVAEGNAIIGMVTLDAAKRVSRGEWAMTRVREITDTDLASLVIDADEPADRLLDRMRKEAHSALIVKKDGHLAGIVTRADMTSYLRRAKIDR